MLRAVWTNGLSTQLWPKSIGPQRNADSGLAQETSGGGGGFWNQIIPIPEWFHINGCILIYINYRINDKRQPLKRPLKRPIFFYVRHLMTRRFKV